MKINWDEKENVITGNYRIGCGVELREVHDKERAKKYAKEEIREGIRNKIEEEAFKEADKIGILNRRPEEKFENIELRVSKNCPEDCIIINPVNIKLFIGSLNEEMLE